MSAIPLLPPASAAASAAPAREPSQAGSAVSVATAALRARQTSFSSLRSQDGSAFGPLDPFIPVYSPYSLFTLGERLVKMLVRKVKVLPSRRDNAALTASQKISQAVHEGAKIPKELSSIVASMATLGEAAGELNNDEVFGSIFDEFDDRNQFNFRMELQHSDGFVVSREYKIEKTGESWTWTMTYPFPVPEPEHFSSLEEVKDAFARDLDHLGFRCDTRISFTALKHNGQLGAAPSGASPL